LRHSLTGGNVPAARSPARSLPRKVAGFDPFPAKPGVLATNEQVNALRDAEGI
jgi:hypothetical protein